MLMLKRVGAVQWPFYKRLLRLVFALFLIPLPLVETILYERLVLQPTNAMTTSTMAELNEIKNKSDDLLREINNTLLQWSSEVAFYGDYSNMNSTRRMDLLNIFAIKAHANPYIYSLYIYFKNDSKVISVFDGIYDIKAFYDIQWLKPYELGNGLLNRVILPADDSRYKKDVLTLFKQFPPMAQEEKGVVVANVDKAQFFNALKTSSSFVMQGVLVILDEKDQNIIYDSSGGHFKEMSITIDNNAPYVTSAYNGWKYIYVPEEGAFSHVKWNALLALVLVFLAYTASAYRVSIYVTTKLYNPIKHLMGRISLKIPYLSQKKITEWEVLDDYLKGVIEEKDTIADIINCIKSNDFVRSIKEGELDKILCAIDELYDKIKKADLSHEQAALLLWVLMDPIFRTTESIGVRIEDILKQRYIDLCHQYEGCPDLEDKCTYIKDLYSTVINWMIDLKQDKSSKIVAFIKEYVENNISDNTSLYILAEKLHMTEPYLSSLFKKESGQTFTEYLTFCRMQKAAEMLLYHDCISITNIAGKVGYSNSRSFSRAFKEYFGISPSDYRNMHFGKTI